VGILELVSDRLLDAAARLQPAGLRSPDAIHLATAQQLGSDLASVVTCDDRMSLVAQASGWTVLAPT
jgi:predicted nucleic acid-binding protein